ncbi:MAG: alpha/beta hydrolase [Gammaproteobacteria bacterium]|nr:alpha/beta hydrolase [Gammaproteobacteria bacterium]
MATYVLVHGGDREGSIWAEVSNLLKEQGHKVFCPSMSSVKTASLQQNIDEIKALIHSKYLKDVILVGHSYGAMVITGVAGQLNDIVSFMVFVDSAVPESGKSLFSLLADYGYDYQHFGLTPDSACVDVLFFDSKQFAQMPKAYILCLRSEFIEVTQPIYDHIVTIAETDNWLYFCLNTRHGCMLTQPKELADILSGISSK